MIKGLLVRVVALRLGEQFNLIRRFFKMGHPVGMIRGRRGIKKDVLRDPALFPLKCFATTREGTKNWTLAWLQIGPPLAPRIGFHVTGPFDVHVAEFVHWNRFCIEGSNNPLGCD